MAPLTQTVVSLLSLAALTAASPLPSAASLFGRAAAPTRVYSPEMHYVFPQDVDVAGASTGNLHLEAFDGKSQVEQVAVFRGVPAEAKSCTIGWSQADKLDRIFLAKGNALTNLQPLSGFPEGDVTYNSVKAFDKGESTSGVDFTSWDAASYKKQSHTGGSIPCATDIYVKVSLRTTEDESSLFYEQNEGNGLFISYTL